MNILVSNSAMYAPRILAHDKSEVKLRQQVAAEDVEAAAMAELYREHQVQWGYRPGVNSGNGRVEMCLPVTLFNFLDEMYPDWASNDKTWDIILKKYPRFKAYK